MNENLIEEGTKFADSYYPPMDKSDTACMIRKLVKALNQDAWLSRETMPPKKEDARILVKLENGLVVIAYYLDNSERMFPWEGWRYEGPHPANYDFTEWKPLTL